MNSTLKPSPEGPWPEAELCPGALDGSGLRVGAGTLWLISYGAGCWGCSVWLLCPLTLWIWGCTLGWIWGWILGWILSWLPSEKHRQVFSPRLLCRVWKRVWIKPQGLPVLPNSQGAGEEPAPPHIHPPGCASSTLQMKPGWLQPPSPSLLAPKAALAAGRASLCHPLQPAKLPGLAPSATRTQLSTGDAPAQRMALTAEWVSPGQAPSTPVCQQGRQGNVSSVTALTPHLLSGKCLITVHS